MPRPVSVFTENGPPVSAFGERTRPGFGGGVRDLYGEFNTPGANVEGASILLRPDAISLDYRTAVTPGPDFVGSADTAYSRVWQVRSTDTQVFLSRGGAVAFEAEVLLFNYAGTPIVELDCAFEQAGRIVVAASRATGAGGAHDVWIYWYDPLLAAFAFQNFGPGRTPRCLLDEPFDTTTSDVLVFYIAEATGVTGTVCYRQQRDRYATQYLTPAVGGGMLEGAAVPPITDLYIEDVIKSRDNRVVLLFSVREAGRYRFTHLPSTLYPFRSDHDDWKTSFTPLSGALPVVLIDHSTFDTENFRGFFTPQATSTLAEPIILYTTIDLDSLKLGFTPQSGIIALPLILHTTYDIENVKLGFTPQSGSVPIVLIIHSTYDHEDVKLSFTPQAASTLV